MKPPTIEPSATLLHAGKAVNYFRFMAIDKDVFYGVHA